jgi:hypothetical protein
MSSGDAIMNYLKKSDQSFSFINRITNLIETDQIELALEIVYRTFDQLTSFEKKLLTINLIAATEQYDIRPYRLPESYFDFLASDESNDIFNLPG